MDDPTNGHRRCPACDEPVSNGEQTCQKCGEPLPYAPDQAGVGCRVCGALINAYAESCPRCGERGFPALRPRKGKGFKGSPAWEAEHSQGGTEPSRQTPGTAGGRSH